MQSPPQRPPVAIVSPLTLTHIGIGFGQCSKRGQLAESTISSGVARMEIAIPASRANSSV